jgi:hypothetical protein
MSTPTLQRRQLRLSTTDEVIAEIERLRKGCRATGNWNLAQVCWHLETATRFRLAPGPYPANTPEQTAARPKLEMILAGQQIPKGIEAPQVAVPPPVVGDEAIDACIATLRRFEAAKGPFAPHRIFGNLSDAEMRRLNLVHCAHHLGHLVPV